jgi:hypothetical protein
MTYGERPAAGEPAGLLVLITDAAQTSTICSALPTPWIRSGACTSSRRERR